MQKSSNMILYFSQHVLFISVGATISNSLIHMSNRYRPRFFDQVGHQTMSAYIENKHLFTKSCHHQTYQNYEQPTQSLQNLYF